MIRLVINKGLYSYERIIFPQETVSSKCDILRYMRFYEISENLRGLEFDIYETPVTDLTLSEDQIKARYNKDTRYKVRRAGRENIAYFVFDELDYVRDEQVISDVIEKYYKFCDQINLPNLKSNLDKTEFKKMIDNGNIVITKAEFENGWTYHVYQADGKNALLWFTFSDHRKENANKSMASRANRGLHDHDIMYFKNKGYLIYDWGNIASKEEPNQIDKFKMSFGGEIKTAYCCFVGNTWKGKLLIMLRNMKNKGEKK